MNLLDEGLSSLDNALKRTARLVKSGRSLYLEINPAMGRRMSLHSHNLLLLGETKDNVAKCKVTDGSLKSATVTEKDLARLEKIEKTLREMQSQKTKVSFEVE